MKKTISILILLHHFCLYGSIFVSNYVSEIPTSKENDSQINFHLIVRIVNNLPIKIKNNCIPEVNLAINNQKNEINGTKLILHCSGNAKEFIFEQPLNGMLIHNSVIELQPTSAIIRYVAKELVNENDLLAIGMNNLNDIKKIIQLFRRPSDSSLQLNNELKKILLTRKQRGIPILKRFILF